MLKDICAAIKSLWAAWRELPPSREEYEQYHDAKMKAESGVFDANQEHRSSPSDSAKTKVFRVRGLEFVGVLKSSKIVRPRSGNGGK